MRKICWLIWEWDYLKTFKIHCNYDIWKFKHPLNTLTNTKDHLAEYNESILCHCFKQHASGYTWKALDFHFIPYHLFDNFLSYCYFTLTTDYQIECGTWTCYVLLLWGLYFIVVIIFTVLICAIMYQLVTGFSY